MSTDNTTETCQISRHEIIRLAEKLTVDYREMYPELAHLGISINKVFEEFIYPDYEVKLIDHLDLGRDINGNQILGQYDAGSNYLFINSCLRNDPRRVFTYWHEFGHIVLHGEWLRRLGSRRKSIITTDVSLQEGTLHELEIQANIFASHGAAPTWLLNGSFLRFFVSDGPLIYNGPSEYSFCLKCGTQFRRVASYSEMCWLTAGFLKRYFAGLSQESLGYRIERSGLVVNRQMQPELPKLNRVAKPSAVRQSTRA